MQSIISSMKQHASKPKQMRVLGERAPMLKPLFACIFDSVALIAYGKSMAVPLWQQSILIYQRRARLSMSHNQNRIPPTRKIEKLCSYQDSHVDARFHGHDQILIDIIVDNLSSVLEINRNQCLFYMMMMG